MDSYPISCHILTRNSAATLEKALQSAQFCAEILVIDGGSTDETLAIAQKYHAKVLSQGTSEEIANFSAIRNLGLKHTTHDWILSLDSDEYLSEEIQKEIQEASKGEAAAYFVPRQYVLSDGRIVDFATTYPNERLYFFHRDTVKEWIKPVHERPQLKEGVSVKRFTGASLAPIGTLEEYKKKNARYLEIEKAKDAGKGWGYWFKHRLFHTVRSRCILLVRLLLIWLIPRRGVRMPLHHELARFWYGWKLIISTMPKRGTKEA